MIKIHIGLIDIDGGNWPNLALMKLSAWWKQFSVTTELLKPNDVLQGQSLFNKYDHIKGAIIFDRNRLIAEQLQKIGVDIGGSGWDLRSRLQSDIEEMYPDYSLYPIITQHTAYGFLTRGCPRQCSFCIVSKKEGAESKQVTNLSGFWREQKYIKLLDPNLLACVGHEQLLQQLIDSKAWIDFTQGLDARLLNPDNANLIRKIKIKMIHFAWDNAADNVTPYMLWHFKKATGINKCKCRVYVLTNYNSTFEEDLYRVYRLREMNYDPYIMIYDKQNAPKQIRHLQRWVNNILIWRTVDKFEDYNFNRRE